MSNKTLEELRAEIKAVYDELVKLGVYPQRINLNPENLDALELELDAAGDQLKRRKRFLGVN